MTQNLISYWRDSLIDSERMGLSGDVFNDPANYLRVDRAEIEAGQINQQATWQFFSSIDNQQQNYNKNNKNLFLVEKAPVLESKSLANELDSESLSGETNIPLFNSADSIEENSVVDILICPVVAVFKTPLSQQFSLWKFNWCWVGCTNPNH